MNNKFNISEYPIKMIIDKKLEELILENTQECTSTTTNQDYSQELTKEKLLEISEKMKPKETGITEILVTQFITTDYMQVLHDKYLCMNQHHFELLNEELRKDSINNNQLQQNFYLIPIITGELADKKYKEYFCKGLSLDFNTGLGAMKP